MNCHTLLDGFIATLFSCSGPSLAQTPPVKIDVGQERVTLDNGMIEMQLSLTGRLLHLARKNGDNLLKNNGHGYWHSNSNGFEDGKRLPQKFYPLDGELKIIQNSEEYAEIVFYKESDEVFPFDGCLHYVLRRGDSGFYLFMTAEHAPDMPSGFIEQYAYNLRLDPEVFRYIAVDDKRQHISHSSQDEASAESIMDATFRLKDGRVVSKYNYCHDIAEDNYHVYGWASKRDGVWLIQPSAEYYPTTPFKQFLSSHQTYQTPIIIWQVHCVHYGGMLAIFDSGERWRKLYGPAFYYVNSGGNERTLWEDAKSQAEKLKNEWPYSWMQHKWFPVQRGKVTGKLALPGGEPARDTWIILSPPGINWSLETKGYHFWTKTDENGDFVIGDVRSGIYDLFAVGADQFHEYKREEIAVDANSTTSLGTLVWNPVTHGRTIWQIGVADRSSGEFRNGDDYRHWGVWRRYPEQFPKDVHFIIGKSKERDDWNFAHWTWHSRTPEWKIEFEMEERHEGNANLTFGIAASRPGNRHRKTDLRVIVNGEEVGRIQLAGSGSAGHRSGRQTTKYSVVTIPFEAALFKKGTNFIVLSHPESRAYSIGDDFGETGSGPGYLMYDAIRLELDY